jgi:hypothetical protein
VYVELIHYESTALFSELAEEWDDLLADSAADRIFLTHEWQRSWWGAYHPGEIWALAVRDDAGRLQGLAPWFRRTEADGRRIVRTIGCVDVTDYLDIIARRGQERAVFEALASHVTRNGNQFDVIKLCNIPEESPALDLAPDVFRNHGFAVDVRLQEVCPVVLLPERWEDCVASLD